MGQGCDSSVKRQQRLVLGPLNVRTRLRDSKDILKDIKSRYKVIRLSPRGIRLEDNEPDGESQLETKFRLSNDIKNSKEPKKMIDALVKKIRTTASNQNTSSQNRVGRFGKENSGATNFEVATQTLTFRAVVLPWFPALFTKGTTSEEKRRNKQRASALLASIYVGFLLCHLFTTPGLDLGSKFAILAFYGVLIGFCVLVSPRAKFEMSMTGFKKLMHPNRLVNGYMKYVFRIPRSREWSELRSVRFQKGDLLPALSSGTLLDAADSIVLDWETRKGWYGQKYCSTDYINLSVLSPVATEQFFQILSSCVPQETLSPEALFLQLQSLSGASLYGDENCEYTDIWLHEFNRRFEISNYVALSPGHKCGNGRFTITMLIRTKINSSTYLAIDEDRKKVFVKELVAPADCEDTVQRKMLEQFNREAALLSRLVHSVDC